MDLRDRFRIVNFVVIGLSIGLFFGFILLYFNYFFYNSSRSEIDLSFTDFLLSPSLQIRIMISSIMLFSVVLSTSILFFLGKESEINTQLKRQNEEIVLTNEKIKKLDLTKAELIASYSHELKTPLTSTRGYLQLLLDGEFGKISSENNKKLNSVLTNIDCLTRLIGEIIDISKIDSSRLNLDIQKTNIKELVVDILEKYQKNYGKKISFSYEVPDDLYLMIDGERLKQIISHLIDNSVDAVLLQNKPGKIIIKVTKQNNIALFEIKDNGIGISEKKIKTLFNRTNEERFRKKSSAGLGLPLVKELVLNFKGNIDIKSEVSKGTVVEFSIPGVVPK